MPPVAVTVISPLSEVQKVDATLAAVILMLAIGPVTTAVSVWVQSPASMTVIE